jgi:processive 1,2-diacylglycerol beta-glucosyltransferase
MIKKKIVSYIEEYNPDVIVYTHVFAGIFLDVIAEKMPLRARTVGIVTDFVMHPFWEEALRTDRVVIPNELLIPAARRKGLLPEQIVPSGIPIRRQFSGTREKAAARRELGLDETKPTLLLMGGSMGYGSLCDNLRALDGLETDMQLICVCGNNKKAKEEIDAQSFTHRVLNFGYTDKIDLLMDAADCIVTKPGGLTTSEALAKRLPMIIANPIPGHEDRNAEFLLNSGAAAMATKTARLTDVVYQLFYHPERLEQMRANIDLIRKPNAAADLITLIESLDKPKA